MDCQDSGEMDDACLLFIFDNGDDDIAELEKVNQCVMEGEFENFPDESRIFVSTEDCPMDQNSKLMVSI